MAVCTNLLNSNSIMRAHRADIFSHLIILMAANVNLQFHRVKGLSVYDIELWHRMRETENNSSTYNASSLGESEYGIKYEKSLRKYYGKSSEESEINDDEIGELPLRRSTQSNRRFYYSWENLLFCDYLDDCDESDVTDESSPPFRPQPPTSTLRPLLPPTQTPFPISPSNDECLGSINDIAIQQENEYPGIPNGYHRYQCSPHAYKFHTEQVFWLDARSRCHKESAELVVIENGAQYDTVVRIAKEMMGDQFGQFHVGFHRQLTAFSWLTVYGDHLPFEKWATCVTNGYLEDANCGGFIVGSNRLDGLTSYPCNQFHSYMCEIKLPSNCV